MIRDRPGLDLEQAGGGPELRCLLGKGDTRPPVAIITRRLPADTD